MILRDQNRRLVILDRKLGAGGEAAVFSVLGRPGVVAKVYHRAGGEHVAKLRVMLANPPADPNADKDHVSICWPSGLLFNTWQACTGFLMPRMDLASSVPIFRLYNPRDRQRVAPGFTWRYLLRTAVNIASALEAIHARDYVVGDLNESNILVTNTALATLVDCDSMQVPRPGTGAYFRCVVGKPEFTAPELQGCAFSQVDRSACHDSFSLAVMIFLLLMEGIHPFDGLWQAGGDVPSIEDRIRLGCFPYAGSGKIAPVPAAPPYRILPGSVWSLVQRCFGRGAHDPAARPAPREWRECLLEVEQNLLTCNENRQHVYANHLAACPWCERRELLGGFDPFPAVIKQVPLGPTVFGAESSPQPAPDLAGGKAFLLASYRLWREPAEAIGLTARFQFHTLAACGVLCICLAAMAPQWIGLPMGIAATAVVSVGLGRIGILWGYPAAVGLFSTPAILSLIAEWRWHRTLWAANGALFALSASPAVTRLLHVPRRPPGRPLAAIWGLAGLCFCAIIAGYFLAGKNSPAVMAPLRIEKFSAVPAEISPGETSKLTWSVRNAGTVFISGDIGSVGPGGERAVSPNVSTTYVLTASGPGGTSNARAAVEVRLPAGRSAEETYAEVRRLFAQSRYGEALKKCETAKMKYAANQRISVLCRQVRETVDILNGKESPKGGT